MGGAGCRAERGVDCLPNCGDDFAGDQRCTTAAAMYRQMDMQVRLEKAEEEIKPVG